MTKKPEHGPAVTSNVHVGECAPVEFGKYRAAFTQAELKVLGDFVRAWPGGATLENGKYYESFWHYRAAQNASPQSQAWS